MSKAAEDKISKNWKSIFDKYDILNKVEKDGSFIITAKKIKEFQEPRLMAKFDASAKLPKIFKDHHLAILPNSRNSYVIGDFSLYKDFETTPATFEHIHIPNYYETVSAGDISSEAVALNALGLTTALEDFFGEENLKTTISGRMTTKDFSFNVSDHTNTKSTKINVSGSQMEIDTSYENANVFVLVEAKAVIYNDFLIRQLFYPYNYWYKHIHKPIKPVFITYANHIYRIIEYEIPDISNYNSIQFVREKKYSLENAIISLQEIIDLSKHVHSVKEDFHVPFVQADTFDNVITLVEHLNKAPMSKDEISELFEFTSRQADYYFNAARYLGFAEDYRDKNEGTLIKITKSGQKLFQLSYEQRQMAFIRSILEHRIFNEVFQWAVQDKAAVTKDRVANKILDLHCNCTDKVVKRRASSVINWINWILDVPNNHE